MIRHGSIICYKKIEFGYGRPKAADFFWLWGSDGSTAIQGGPSRRHGACGFSLFRPIDLRPA